MHEWILYDHMKKKQDTKEVTCPGCNDKVKPIIIKNKINSAGLFGYGRAGSGLPRRKFLLKCPKCGYLLGSK